VKDSLNEELALNTTELDEDEVLILAEPKMKAIKTLTEVLIDEVLFFFNEKISFWSEKTTLVELALLSTFHKLNSP
jgi:hypothetical protein